ncbi:alpha/beta fold hydrolase [Brevirhabdus sp.]|uniref:alpha/beta fold hydrolase n=1 Tax=Brevirhabdus sp. TaxID=2004514 RepID=UPI00405885EC
MRHDPPPSCFARRDWGAGDSRRLMIHCSLASSASWDGVVRALDARGAPAHSVAFDLPGHGRSRDLRRGEDIQDLAVAWAGRLLPPGGQVDLIGHSFGATVALRLALEQPERVRRLVLIEPPLIAVVRGSPAHERHRREEAAIEEAMLAGDGPLAARLFTERWGSKQPWDALPERHRSYITDRIGLVGAQADAIHHDRAGLLTPGRLENLDLPVLLLEGSRSPHCVAQIQRGLLARLPDARRAVIEGAAHMLPLTHPAEVAERIAKFLATEKRAPDTPAPRA